MNSMAPEVQRAIDQFYLWYERSLQLGTMSPKQQQSQTKRRLPGAQRVGELADPKRRSRFDTAY